MLLFSICTALALLLTVSSESSRLNLQASHQASILPPAADHRRPIKSFRGDHSKTLLQNIALHPDLSKLHAILQTRKLLSHALNESDADLTLFAPSNAAFDKAGDIPDDDSLTNARYYLLCL